MNTDVCRYCTAPPVWVGRVGSKGVPVCEEHLIEHRARFAEVVSVSSFFKCAVCKGHFRQDEEKTKAAEAEMHALYGGPIPEERRATVCEDCFALVVKDGGGGILGSRTQGGGSA
jgi:hypothetical protein